MAILNVGGALGGSGGNLGTLYVKLAADGAALVNGMDAAVSTVEGSVGLMTKALGLLTTATAGIATFSVAAYAKFNQAMTQSTAIMGDMTAKMNANLESTARALSMTGNISATKLAKSYYDLASAGLTAGQAIQSLPIVSRFATAGLFDITKAADSLASSQHALNLSMKDPIQNMENMARLADILVKANNIALGTVEDFADALSNKAAGAMRTYGLEVEQGVAVLAELANKGVKGLKAGEEFSILLVQLQSAARKSREVFDELGISVFDSFGKFRPISDVLYDMEKAFSGLTPEIVAAKLHLLGFQDRSIAVIRDLLGSSKAIKENEIALKAAGGTAQEVADKQMKSFSNQLTITWHLIEDMAITIGEVLAPVLLDMNQSFRDAFVATGGFHKQVQELSIFLQTVLVGSVNTVLDLFRYFKDAVDGVGLAMVYTAEVALRAWNYLASGIGFVVNGITNAVISGINLGIRRLNDLIFLMPDWLKTKTGVAQVNEIKWKMDFDFQNDKVAEWANKFKEIRDGIKKDLVATAVETEKTVTTSAAAMASTVATATISAFHRADAVIESEASMLKARILTASKEMSDMLDKVGAPNGKNILGMDKIAMTPGKANRAALRSVDEVDRDTFIPMSNAEKNLAIKGVGTGDNGAANTFNKNIKEQEDIKTRLQALKIAGEEEVRLTGHVQQQKLQAIELYGKQVAQLQKQQTQLVLTTTSGMFDDLANIAATFGGKSSGAFQALFAISKAFAIAKAIIDIQLAIADVAATGATIYDKLAGIATITAATSGIVSAISSTVLSFGGGKALGGNVEAGTAYMVGERRPEMFVPGKQGAIVPNDKLGGKVNVVINNHTDIVPVVSESQTSEGKTYEIMFKRMQSEIAGGIRQGTGPVASALSSAFKLRRGQG